MRIVLLAVCLLFALHTQCFAQTEKNHCKKLSQLAVLVLQQRIQGVNMNAMLARKPPYTVISSCAKRNRALYKNMVRFAYELPLTAEDVRTARQRPNELYPQFQKDFYRTCITEQNRRR